MVLFLIATHNRPDKLSQLVCQIESFCPFPYKIIVVDDGSSKDYKKVRDRIESSGGAFRRYRANCGREGYWRVMTRLFQEAKRQKFDYLIKLDDDIQLHPQAIQRSLYLYDVISAHKEKRVLNMWVDHRAEETIWTHIPAKIICVNGIQIRRVGWIDGGNWVTNRRVMEILGWECPKPPDSWWDKPGDSSGVGKYLSIELQKYVCKIFMPMKPMVYHGTHPSQMHPDKKNRPIEMNQKPW